MGRASGIGCAVEVRDRPELFRVVVRIDRGFEVTGIEPWTYLLSAGRDQGRFLPLFGIFWRKTSGTSGGAHATPTKASLLAPRVSYRYSPTYKLNGSSFGSAYSAGPETSASTHVSFADISHTLATTLLLLQVCPRGGGTL